MGRKGDLDIFPFVRDLCVLIGARMQSFCCDKPPPYTGCDWYYHGGNFWGQIPFVCTGTCPAGKAVIATDPTSCWSGVFNAISMM